MPDGPVAEGKLEAEDEKLVVLARAARARNGAAEGAAVRDTDGRTYAATTVDLASFQVSALQAAIAAAVSSGAENLEAAAVVTQDALITGASVQAVRDLAPAAPIFRADPSGTVREVLRVVAP